VDRGRSKDHAPPLAAGDSIYALQSGKLLVRSIVRVSVATGKIEPVLSFPHGTIASGDCTQTPDWRSLICAITESNRDAWIIEGLKANVY
jgi:hypothetical protein